MSQIHPDSKIASKIASETAVESVLVALRRGQRQLVRTPRATVRGAVRQLLDLGGRITAGPVLEPGRTYRIDELAHATGVTSRNIRSYQERGLLHRPARVGRTSVYDDTHRARLRIITSMFDRGYAAAHVLEMLQAWEGGQGLGSVLGLEQALVAPGGVDEPRRMSAAQAQDLAGGETDLRHLTRAGLVEVEGDEAQVLRPQLLRAFAEMRKHGMDTPALVDIHQQVEPKVKEISKILVEAGVEQLADRFLEATGAGSSAQEVTELVAVLTRYRALALTTVTATLATSIEATIEDLLADFLSQAVLGEAAETG